MMLKSRARNRRKSRENNKCRKMHLQTLERRELMAGDISFSDGILTITGTKGRDMIEVGQEGTQIVASIQSTTMSHRESVSSAAVNKVVVLASDGDDVIINDTAKQANLYGEGGDDLITGGRSYDYVSGGSGNDAIYGGSGNDRLYGKTGDDKLFGEAGHDTIVADSGNDQLIGGAGNDRMWGDAGADGLWGGSGSDELIGGAGRDYLGGGGGSDTLWGGDDKDLLDGSSGNDRLYGGASDDVVFGGTGHDRIYGQSGDDLLSGESGNDKLYGSSGRDRIFGGSGRDYLHGGPSRDELHGGTEYDRYANVSESMRSNDNGPSAPSVSEPGGRNSSAISQHRLQQNVDAAIDNWQDAGLNSELVDVLAQAKFRVTDLPANKSAMFTRTGNGDAVIWLDDNAGGPGWFVDATPDRIEEFVSRGNTLHTNQSSSAPDRIDLVSVIAHELGHVVGLADTVDDGLMGHAIGLGIRVLPDSGLVDSIDLSSVAPVVADWDFPQTGLNPSGGGNGLYGGVVDPFYVQRSLNQQNGFNRHAFPSYLSNAPTIFGTTYAALANQFQNSLMNPTRFGYNPTRVLGNQLNQQYNRQRFTNFGFGLFG